MMKRMRIQVTALLLAAIVAALTPPLALAASRQELERDAAHALKSLYANNTAARLLGQKAKAVLVFSNIVKAGFMFGGQMGDGVPTPSRKDAKAQSGYFCERSPFL
jgi:lipid-binding SYLF domain-containing protein